MRDPVAPEQSRHVPYDVEVEQALLGTILVNNETIRRVSGMLKPEHFYDPLHQRLFEAMLVGHDDLTITPLTLNAALKADPGLIEVGGHAYLARLAAAAPAMPNVVDYARILRGLAVRRGLIHVAENIVNAAYEAPMERSALSQLRDGEAALQALWEAEADHLGGRLPVIDLAQWEGTPLPERRWLVPNRIPARNVALLSGEGAVGKTLLAQQLAVATVLGADWLGVTPKAGRVLLICCEDDDDEIHIRLAHIADFYGVDFARLRTDLFPISLAGQTDTVIAQPDRYGLIRPTPLYNQIFRYAQEIRPALIVLDNSADLFAGDENNRVQVRQFVALLRRMDVQIDTTTLLTSHPSLRGIENGSGISGSTAWHASVRSRLYMRRPKPEAGAHPTDSDERVLEVMKNNYGPSGETISLRWQGGLFVPTGGVHWIDKRASETAVDELFLRLLQRYSTQGRNVSHKVTAPGTYAPKLFAAEPEANGVKKTAFEGAMNRLFAKNAIRVEQYGRPSQPREKIVFGIGV